MSNAVKQIDRLGRDAAGTTHELKVCGEEVKATLVTSEHGYDDYDLAGQPLGVRLRRICVPHTVKHGEPINVYFDDSSKRGAAWRGSLQKTLEGFVKEQGHEAGLRWQVCLQCNAGGADPKQAEVYHQCGPHDSFRQAGQAASTSLMRVNDVEKLRSVMMQDVVGDYDDPATVPEWKWVEGNASFAHRGNGTAGVHEFVVNLSRTFTGIPEKLKPLLESSREAGISYLLFHQGT